MTGGRGGSLPVARRRGDELLAFALSALAAAIPLTTTRLWVAARLLLLLALTVLVAIVTRLAGLTLTTLLALLLHGAHLVFSFRFDALAPTLPGRVSEPGLSAASAVYGLPPGEPR
jgi:hypothetical protein